MKIAKIFSLILSAIILCTLAGPAGATPEVDGRQTAYEDYDHGSWVNLDVVAPKKGTTFSDQGQLWTYQDPTNNDLYVSFMQPVSLVDNSYGRNAAGWGKKKHNFNQLVNSDSARFQILDSYWNVLFDFSMDYISRSRDRKSKSRYSSLGATGKDGAVHEGSLGSLLEWGTSLDYNFNELGYTLTKNSPTLGDAKYPGWRYEMTYEFRIDGSLFEKSGYSKVVIPYLHNSPNKVGGNTIYTKYGGMILYPYSEPIPEPATVCLLGLGSLCLLRKRRTRKAA